MIKNIKQYPLFYLIIYIMSVLFLVVWLEIIEKQDNVTRLFLNKYQKLIPYYRRKIGKKMRQLGRKKKGTLSIQDNQKIISLIKAKISPIQKNSHKSKLIIRDMNASAPNFYNKPSREYQIIQAKQLNTFQLLTRQPSIDLIRRAKQYIEEKRKVLKYIDRPVPNIDLNAFITLFDMEKNSENENMKEFLKMRKESLQMLTFYDKPKKVQNSERMEIQQKSSEQCSLINARIRRRLNHRKIITLYKKT